MCKFKWTPCDSMILIPVLCSSSSTLCSSYLARGVRQCRTYRAEWWSSMCKWLSKDSWDIPLCKYVYQWTKKEHTPPFKFGVSKDVLFRKEALNWSKVTVKGLVHPTMSWEICRFKPVWLSFLCRKRKKIIWRMTLDPIAFHCGVQKSHTFLTTRRWVNSDSWICSLCLPVKCSALLLMIWLVVI